MKTLISNLISSADRLDRDGDHWAATCLTRIAERLAKKKDAPTEHTSVIVALVLPKAVAKKLVLKEKDLPESAAPELPEELHITLAYLGKVDEIEGKKEKIEKWVKDFARDYSPLEGKISGVGRFIGGDSEALYASFDSPALNGFREDLIDMLEKKKVTVVKNHGFTPHITLTYLPKNEETPDVRPKTLDVVFSEVTLLWGGVPSPCPFNG